MEPENVEECAESVCSKDLSRIPGWLVSFGLFGQKIRLVIGALTKVSENP